MTVSTAGICDRCGIYVPPDVQHSCVTHRWINPTGAGNYYQPSSFGYDRSEEILRELAEIKALLKKR